MSPSTEARAAFEAELVALIPHLRAFGRSLAGDPVRGDDLAQEALTKAWAKQDRFEPGTNLRAWTFMILRNQFFSEKRRDWRGVELDPEVAERTLVANDNPTGALELEELRRALFMLQPEQREALILVGAAGLSYDETAEITGVAVGTVKSRVSRARDRLALLYAEGFIDDDGGLPSAAMNAILLEIDRLQCRSGVRTAIPARSTLET